VAPWAQEKPKGKPPAHLAIHVIGTAPRRFVDPSLSALERGWSSR